jgi:tRNA modification GTPase
MARETASLRIVQLTPPGRGAIATLLVEGPGARECVEGQFRSARGRPLRDCPAERLLYGRFGPLPGEEVVVCCRSEQSIEIHCHGGDAAVTRITGLLGQAGAAMIAWRAWALLHHEDPIAAAAHLALADARTERTAAILLDQYRGVLRQAWEEIRTALAQGDVSRTGELLETLLARARIGRHLVQPWRVVLAGEPNVGKSSLINALLGYQRTIVHPTPGTTRDVVTATAAVDGWPLEFCDTAGLRESEQPLERAGVQRANEQLAAADLAILVFDISRPWSMADEILRQRFPAAVVVHNKSDLAVAGGAGRDEKPVPSTRPPGIVVSALTGDSIPKLLELVVCRLVPQPPAPGVAIPFTAELIARLDSARKALARSDRVAALESLADH